MESLLGSSVAVFVGLTLVMVGGAALMTGHAIAATWKPARQAALAALGLGLADRFLVYALFGGPLLHLTGFVVHTAALVAIALAAHRVTRVGRMVDQYPWLYERAGPASFRERRGT